MRKTIKNLFFGALVATAVAGAFTATAKSAHATEICDACPEGMSGYLIATGLGGTACVDASDEEYIRQCGGGH